MNIQDWFPLGWTCSPRDSQESSPTPQFKSISSSALSFLYSPTLTSIHDYWEIYWRFTAPSPAHQNKTQFPPQSVSPIMMLPQASYSSPSEGRQTENHNHRKLTTLITWTTALSNSRKLWAMPCTGIQDRWVIVERSDRMWSTGEGNGKPLQYSCLENPMNSMKRQNDRILKEKLPRSVGA